MLLQIKRCHQPKPQSRLPERPSPGVAPLSAMHKELEPEALKAAPDMETIRSRVGELKSRLGSLQNEIREYNTQMEHKVNVLMQILQASTPAQAGLPMPPQSMPHLQQPQQPQQPLPPNAMNQPSYCASQPMQSQSMLPHHHPLLQQQQQLLQQAQQQHAQPGMCGPLGLQQMGAGAGSPSAAAIDNLFRGGGRDSLFGSLGDQSFLGAGGLNGLGGLGGLGGFCGGMGGAAGMNMSSLTHGLMGQLSGLGALANAQKPGEVAGLQHLLEAAQRYHSTDDGKGDGGPPAKRFHADLRQNQHETAAHA